MLELSQISSFFPKQLRHFKRNILREYLQYKILEIIFKNSYGRKLVFMGGTAIHIAHGLPRFSEDLDFDNRGLSKNDFCALTKEAGKKLALEGYVVETGASCKATFSADIKVMNILFETGISAHKGEKVLIKLDAQPQDFKYPAHRIVINKFDVFSGINIVPESILLAQKYYAILARKRAMGRDFYDAIFLAGKTEPDFGYLNKKTGIKNRKMLRAALLARCVNLDFKLLSKDVEQFLFSPEDAGKIACFKEYVRGWKI